MTPTEIAAILEEDDEDRWLAAEEPETRKSLPDPYPGEGLEAFEISTAVNDPGNDSPSIVEPVGHGQSGLGEF